MEKEEQGELQGKMHHDSHRCKSTNAERNRNSRKVFER